MRIGRNISGGADLKAEFPIEFLTSDQTGKAI